MGHSTVTYCKVTRSYQPGQHKEHLRSQWRCKGGVTNRALEEIIYENLPTLTPVARENIAGQGML